MLTAASIACRCFPDATRIFGSPALMQAPLLLWPSVKLTFGDALAEILGPSALAGGGEGQGACALIFGDAMVATGALRVTFDGWIAKVGPVQAVPRLPEREYFSVAGILAASLALSELFVSFAEINLEATRRTLGMSLWRPVSDIDDPEALSIPVEYLPRDLWVRGLRHLGNAYLWSLATLPYEDPKAVEFALFDFDKVEKDNIETGVILTTDFLDRFKTRACDAWLDRRNFRTRLVERRFDATFRLQDEEPRLALCGFDANPARRDLVHARFRRVIDSGLGGMANNFDTISLRTLPTRGRRRSCGRTRARKKTPSSPRIASGSRAKTPAMCNSAATNAGGGIWPANPSRCPSSARAQRASWSPRPCGCCTMVPPISTSSSGSATPASGLPAATEAIRRKMRRD